jgi:hypothetical protein
VSGRRAGAPVPPDPVAGGPRSLGWARGRRRRASPRSQRRGTWCDGGADVPASGDREPRRGRDAAHPRRPRNERRRRRGGWAGGAATGSRRWRCTPRASGRRSSSARPTTPTPSVLPPRAPISTSPCSSGRCATPAPMPPGWAGVSSRRTGVRRVVRPRRRHLRRAVRRGDAPAG